jgi:hypothetical protein
MTHPDAIDTYLQAHDRGDALSALTALAPDATVVDDGHRYDGHDQIGSWITGSSNEYTTTRTLVSAEATGADTWVVINHIEGNFPGGTVDLRYEFTLADDLITKLVIAP